MKKMSREELKELYESIHKEYVRNYEGSTVMYKGIEKHAFMCIYDAFYSDKITRDELYELANYIFEKILLGLLDDFLPDKLSNGKAKFKFVSMTPDELRTSMEDSFSKIEELEYFYDLESMSPEEERRVTGLYRFYSLMVGLAAKELSHREFKISDIEIAHEDIDYD